jgi:hypothetical protein
MLLRAMKRLTACGDEISSSIESRVVVYRKAVPDPAKEDRMVFCGRFLSIGGDEVVSIRKKSRHSREELCM